MSDGLTRWVAVPVTDSDFVNLYFGNPATDLTPVVCLPGSYARTVAEQHNAEVAAALTARPTIVSVEAMLSRVVADALRELIRGAMPRWTRRKGR